MTRAKSETRAQTDIERICAALERTYSNPRHGNKRDPLDELIYIILSTRTRDAAFRQTYRRVKRAYPKWSLLTPDDESRLAAILAPSGLSQLKANQIVAIIQRLRNVFGRPTLTPIKEMRDEEAEAFLTSLPGVAAKIAKCVLMYSLDRPVLPVDVHVHRVASRIGLTVKKRPDTSQTLIEGQVPEQLRYGFHVNAVAHGRAVCLPRNPRCDACILKALCAEGTTRRREAS